MGVEEVCVFRWCVHWSYDQFYEMMPEEASDLSGAELEAVPCEQTLWEMSSVLNQEMEKQVSIFWFHVFLPNCTSLSKV